MDSQIDPPLNDERKKFRAQLSCTQCRHKKLKCNRGNPCDQCTKRTQGHLCQYATNLARNKPTQFRQMAGPRDILSRVRHLEGLVLSLRPDNTSNKQINNTGSTNILLSTPRDNDDQVALSRPTGNLTIGEQVDVDSPGTMIVDQIGTRWVDASHWQTILDGITELKDCTETLEQGNNTAAGMATEENQAPFLFVGVFPSTSKAEILAFLPSRPVVDRLVSRFFNAKEPGLMMLHVPTFYREYTQFWDNQEEASSAWIGLLFAILCFSVIFYHRVGDILPGSLGEPMLVSKAYMAKTAQCLVLADYTKPGRYKVETLILYFGAELMQSSDSQLGVSMLLGIIIRLAMHMGYHRDSKHYPNVSVFEGEMKRRVWAMVSQMDHLISFQAGVPRIIPDSQCDTELPHNLFDEDFDETTKLLPPSRPPTERTTVSYTITKGKIMSVFGRITEKSHSMSISEQEVVQLDKCLIEAHASFPPFLRIRAMNLSITDPPDLIMQRYTLELLYQKARCVLHRKYLTLHRSDMRYAYSRWVCVDAAMQILGHQNEIYNEILPGGQLYRDRWFMSSLMTHDFLLAAMIVCVELSYKADKNQPALDSEAVHANMEEQHRLLEYLEVSHRIWVAFSGHSLEAKKAVKALSVMLHNAKKKDQREHQPNPSHLNVGIGEEGPCGGCQFAENMPNTMFAEQHDYQTGNQNMVEDPVLRAIEGIMDPAEAFDWEAWDNQIQYTNMDISDSTGMDRSASDGFDLS